MTRYGYDPKPATGLIAASSTITQIIPPPLVLVVLADTMGKSVGDMHFTGPIADPLHGADGAVAGADLHDARHQMVSLSVSIFGRF